MNHANKLTTNAHAHKSLLASRLRGYQPASQKERVKAMLKRRGLIQ